MDLSTVVPSSVHWDLANGVWDFDQAHAQVENDVESRLSPLDKPGARHRVLP
jgi:hypothetical protein